MYRYSKQNLAKFAKYRYSKRNLRKFKRNAMYRYSKQNLRKFDSISKENWRNEDYAASVIRVAALGKTLSGQQPAGIVFKQDSSHE